MSAEQLASLSRAAFAVALVAYVLSAAGYFHFLAFRRQPVWRAASVLAWAGLGAHVASVVTRGLAAGRVPLGNMYEYSTMLALLVVVAYLLLAELRYGVRTLGGFALGFAVVTMAVAQASLYVYPAPLVPALNSYWREIHVTAAIVGSSLFSLGGIFSLLFVVRDRRERRTTAVAGALAAPAEARVPATVAAEATGAGAASPVADTAPPHFAEGADEPAGGRARRRGLLPSAALLDRLAYRTIAVAFPIWTFAVIAGAIWAEAAWGRYWGWDPKETWAFITWVLFAGYLHARATAGWKGRRAAVLALIGFAALMITYYAVNLFIVGLHSYAK